jgi:uncharacterized membrane protein YdfJ with MMPL/SSD domain
MIFANSKRLLRYRLAAIVATVVFTVALVSAAPPAAAQSTESPPEAPPVVTLQAFLLDKGVFAPLDVPCVTQVSEEETQ